MNRGEHPFLVGLREVAHADPSHSALLDETSSLTYGQVLARIDRQASALTEAGVDVGDRVALVADNCVDYLVAAAAVWSVGGVLVTVYPSSAVGELTYCLASSDPSMVLVSGRVEKAVREAAPGLPVADIRSAQLPRARRSTLEESRVDDLGLICFTSGSTARPKAVMHTNHGLVAAARAYARVWHLGPADRTIVCLPMAWAFGLVTTSMATLLSGGTVLSLERTRPEHIVRAIERDRATFLAGVTTMFAKVVDHLQKPNTGPVDLASLRLCISGGEPRNEAVFAAWTSLAGCPVHDVYAASECFPVVTYDPDVDPQPVYRSAGTVVAGAAMRVVDPEGSPVPPGVAGEALWRGPATFVGYWGDPEQTSKALTPDGWYRTNDLVRVDQRGYVFVEGRLSDMIIRGGSNVSPSEVEAVLRAHPSVRDAAVVGLPDEEFGQQVVAVVVPATDEFPEDAVRAHCRRDLAAYKIPAQFVVASQIPTNSATGKVNRRHLAESLSGSLCPDAALRL